MAPCKHKSSPSGNPMRNNANLNYAIGLNRFSLELIGAWPDGNEKAHGFKNLRILFMISCLVLFIFVPQMYALSQVFRQLPLAIDNITTSSATFVSVIKLWLLWNSRKALEPVVTSIIADWTSSKPLWEMNIMKKQARRARMFTISGYAIMFSCFFGFIALPLCGLSTRIVNNITDPNNGRYFPLQTKYPFPSEMSPYFELTYLSQLVTGSFVGIAFSVPDNWFGCLVFHASAQCEILKIKLSEISPNDFNLVSENRERRNKLLQLKLIQHVKTHVQLIKFVNAIEESFNELILVQVVFLSLIMCCLGFGVLRFFKYETEVPTFQVVTLAGTLFNLLIHMLIYCIASEIVTAHSSDFSQAIYFSYWYLLPAACARDMIFVMNRSKFPLRLSAGKFFYLSLYSYLRILKTAFGYTSVLLAVNN